MKAILRAARSCKHRGARRGCGEELIDGPQEGRERLAGAGGRDHECVLALRHGCPGARLRGGGSAEGCLEPPPGWLGERSQGGHGLTLEAATDMS